MAVQGVFEADFTQFNGAIDAAVAKLRTFKVTTSDTSGGLTATDAAAKKTTSAFTTFANGLSTADKSLAAFGVHLGPEIQALHEIGDAAGKTTTELGLLGTASLALAAGFGAYSLATKAIDFFGLTDKVQYLYDGMFNLSVATEEAGAKQDVINRAIKAGAPATVTYGEAVAFNAEAAKKASAAAVEHAKALEETKKAAEAAAEALNKAQAAYTTKLQGMADDLFGNDAIAKATDWIAAMGRVENVDNLSADSLVKLRTALQDGFDAMVRQGQAGDDLANTFNQFIVAVDAATASHTTAIAKMETDEERFARENDELAKAMKDNFVVIGQSAAEAAQKVSLSWNEALDAVRKGQGTLGGSFQSVAPGAPGSSIRYDDYGNPYGYVPGVNAPGKISPASPGASIFIDARESFFDTAAGAQRLADKVVSALGARAGSVGVGR